MPTSTSTCRSALPSRRRVVLHPVPVDIVEIVPAFRRYKYFVLASGEIVIVDPATLVVVYVVRLSAIA